MMAVRFTRKTYMQALFLGWKTSIKQTKHSRHWLLARVWRYLQINVKRRKYLRCQALMLLRERRLRIRDALVKACFDALRQHKQSHKLLKVRHELFKVEIPRKEATALEIETRKEDFKLRQRNLALCNALHIKATGVYQYFRHWQQHADHHRVVLATNVRQRLIHRYHWVLAQAFTRWVNHRGKAILQGQRQEIGEWEGENASATT